MKIQARLKGAAAPIAITFAILSQPATAQDVPVPVSVITAEDLAEQNSSDVEEAIVVTGSRIRRTTFNSPDPITIIDPEIAKAQGQSTTAGMLYSSPIAAGSAQVTSAISSAFVTDGGIGAETISLRGLGANRTLVLLNGRRAGPAGTRGGVSAFDLNVLPLSVVENVEILKTGASSIYGSDAVAGVVNVITKKDTDGIEFDGFASMPFESGGEQYRFSGTWGKDFGNGHILVSGDYSRDAALNREDREYLDCAEEYIFNEAGARVDVIDPRTDSPRCNDTLWGHVWVYDYFFRQAGLYQPDYGDNLGQYISPNIPTGQPGINSTWALGTPPGFFKVSHNTAYPLDNNQTAAALGVQNVYHPFMAGQSVVPKSERYTGYVDAAFEISDNLEIGGEFLYNKRTTEVQSYRQFYYLTGYTGNFTPVAPGFGDPFAPGWSGPWFISPTAITDHAGDRIEVDYYRGVGWLDGSFGSFLDGWNYNAYVQFSRSDGRYEDEIIYADAVNLHDYRTDSCVGQTLAAGQPCIDIDWTTPDFLRGNLTDAQKTMLFGVDIGNTRYDQLVSEASVSGPLFSLPAGQVQVALGGSYRGDKLHDAPGNAAQTGNVWNSSSAGVTAGDSDTLEAFGEIEIPLLRDIPLVQSFTLTGSARVTNVKATRASDNLSQSDNGNWTYSIGANWEVTDWLQFRARYGTSFRAPALFEQFLADETSSLTQRQVDVCIQWGTAEVSQRIKENCAAHGVPADHSGSGVGAEIFTQGGFENVEPLQPETSKAFTASAILRPRFAFAPNTTIDIALDYFDIEINDEIASLSAGVVYNCYNSEFFPDEPYCDLFTRYAENTSGEFNIETIFAPFINISSQRNAGFDLTVDIQHDFGSMGTLQLLSQMNWQTKDRVEVFAGRVLDNNGEVGEPQWVGDFNLVWRSADESWRVFYGLDVVGKSDNIDDYVAVNGGLCRAFRGYNVVNNAAQPICPDLVAEATFYHSFSVEKEFDRFTVTAGVANIFDTSPPRVTIAGGNSLNSGVIDTVGQAPYASQYDYFGRRVFLSASAKF